MNKKKMKSSAPSAKGNSKQHFVDLLTAKVYCTTIERALKISGEKTKKKHTETKKKTWKDGLMKRMTHHQSIKLSFQSHTE